MRQISSCLTLDVAETQLPASSTTQANQGINVAKTSVTNTSTTTSTKEKTTAQVPQLQLTGIQQELANIAAANVVAIGDYGLWTKTVLQVRTLCGFLRNLH